MPSSPSASLRRSALAFSTVLALLVVVALLAPTAAASPGRNPADAAGHVVAGEGDPVPGVVSLPHLEPPPPPNGEPAAASHLHCSGGLAGPYPCKQVDLLAFVPRSALGAAADENLNDIWGWTDPQSGAEYALVGEEGGTAFVDISDPENPVFVGKLPTRTFRSAWRDIKTYRNHAFIVADASPDHGMQVFNLTQLRNVTGGPVTFQPTAEYHGPGFNLSTGFALGSSHNLGIDEETGFAYAVGSNTCSGGLHMIDIRDPARPRFAGCFSDDGYTHDVECVVYRGPDSRYTGREICFASNEDTITVVDVNDKSAPVMLSRTGYAGSAYTHQAWLTADHHYLLSDDELDELNFHHGSRTYIWDVSDLTRPALIGEYTSPSPSTDHNLYIRDNLVYESNYRSGLRILDLARVGEGRLNELAYFDVEPASDAPGFAGAWSVYPYFSSGVVVVSGIGTGLFVLRPFPEAEHAPHGPASADGPPLTGTDSPRGEAHHPHGGPHGGIE